MARLILPFILIITLAGGSWAQAPVGTAENENPKVSADSKSGTDSKTATGAEAPHLAVVETVTSLTETGNGFAGLSCDEDGNIFLGPDGPNTPAIRKLNEKGELAALMG